VQNQSRNRINNNNNMNIATSIGTLNRNYDNRLKPLIFVNFPAQNTFSYLSTVYSP